MSEKLNLNILKDNLALVIQNEIANMRLLQDINKEYSYKGLNTDVPSMLFNKELTVDDLNDNELIALCKSIFNFVKQNNKEIKVNINPSDYFTDSALTNYDLYEAPKEEEIETIVFEDCQQIDANTYWFFIKGKQLKEIRRANKIGNFKGIQRARKIVTLPNGEKIEKINVNKKGLKALNKRFKAHNIKPTTITLTVLDLPNKDPNVTFTPEYKCFGRLEVTPDFNRESPNYTPLIINDGNHRYTSLCDACEEDKTAEEEGLGVFLFVMNPDEAKQFTADTFEQNATDKKYVDTLKNTSDNKFIQNLISNSNILRGKVSNVISECKAFKTLTYLSVLNDCVKFTNIDVSNDITSIREAKRIANIIDTIIDYLLSEYFNNDIEQMKAHPFLLRPNTFVGYIAIANAIKNNEYYQLSAGSIADLLVKIEENLGKTLKLDNKDCDVKAIYEYFDKIAKEVM